MVETHFWHAAWYIRHVRWTCLFYVDKSYLVPGGDTYDDHTINTRHYLPCNNTPSIILPTLPPLYTGHSIGISARIGYVIIRLQ